ncbi:hypothetical protein [Streptomyces sp. NPDC053367]|uniref:hypothetical protein n=1 Tax=Streptomyces sp. NPDC053367 TaxID=3365700 RepID=UPI0037D03F0D
MRNRAAAVVAATAALALTATACSDSTSESPADVRTSPTASASASAELTEEQRASIREAAGLPPTPKPAEWAAYIKGLNAIDADIVHGKEEKAVRRGIDTCSSFKRYPDDSAKLVATTRQRFTSPTHPEGRDAATAERILEVAHAHICPDF